MSIRHALLALLSEGPKYGLQLRQEFEARTGEVWPLNVGQVYTTLQRLERDGFVASDDTTDEGAQKNFQTFGKVLTAMSAAPCSTLSPTLVARNASATETNPPVAPNGTMSSV